ncbi:beta-lactamase family protein [Kitasatospora sp. NBC_01560]|uniref:serine hydrolase domain-containing protein n=1 Tax=Kitasatospora sp. NBC_01560 TaxID=2975965 RepID=UPI00386A3FD2
MTRPRTAALLCAATLIATGLQATATAAAGVPEYRPCVSSPEPAGGPAREVLDIARRAKEELHLKSVVLRVTVDGRELVTGALGESMTGVPAEPRMHFRAGSVAIAYLGTVLLQLVDEQRVGLDDPLARWLPDAPHADRITLRMLGDSTSGLADYVTDPGFLADYNADPFRQWTPGELVGISAAHPLWYAPGTNWSYSHANFQLLGAALEKITGTPLDELLEQRVMGPLGLRDTRDGGTPDIPTPVLHSFTAERGTYEESTFWNPSWTTAPGAVLTTHICDLARSAEAIGAGQLLSEHAYRTQLDPGTVGLPGPTRTCPDTVCLPGFNTEERHFGLGVTVVNGWVIQNPSFAGYAAVQAYLPADRIAVAVTSTKDCDAPAGNNSDTITKRIAAALAPDHPID